MPTNDANLLHYFLQDDIYLLKADKALYAAQPNTQPEIETPKPVFNYLGGNKEKFLILVNYPADEHMDGAHLKSLESTVGRKSLTIDDIAILNIAKYAGSHSLEILDFFSPSKVLILGADVVPLDLPASAFNVIENKPHFKQLHTYSFTEMIANQDLKRPFWDQIKNF